MATTTSMRTPATLADLEALAPEVKGEIIDGVLYTQARPRARHSNTSTWIATDLHGPFQRGRGGPGGWWIVVEPGIGVPGSPEFSPDVAGWRREKMPGLPAGRFDTVPDWICEVLSPSNYRYDLAVKRAFYARIGVGHLWYVDLDAELLTVSRLEAGRWLELGVHGGTDRLRAEPFASVELALGDWWGTASGG